MAAALVASVLAGCSGGSGSATGGGSLTVVLGRLAPNETTPADADQSTDSTEKGGQSDAPAFVGVELNAPEGVAADGSGNVYVSDKGNHSVYKLDPKGRVTTVIASESSEDRDKALVPGESIEQPGGLALDGSGRLAIADEHGDRLVVVDSHNKPSSIPAGLKGPLFVAAGKGGSFYVANQQRVVRIDANGASTPLAGGGQEAPGRTPRPATEILLPGISAMTVTGDGSVLVGDASVGRIDKIDPAGKLSVFAGEGRDYLREVPDGSSARDSYIGVPRGLATDGNGNVYFARVDYNQITRIDSSGRLHDLLQLSIGGRRVATTAPGFPGASPLHMPGGLAIGPHGSLYSVQTGSPRQVVKLSNAASGRIQVEGIASPGDPPTISEIKPATGGDGGGTAVVVTGGGIDEFTTVEFGDREARVLQVFDGRVLALSPPGRDGETVQVVVSNQGAASTPSAASKFTYVKGWGEAAPMAAPMALHTATLLDPPGCHAPPAPAAYPCGQVLVTGGDQGFCITCYPMNATELYDPAADAWRAGPPMHVGRIEQSATLLPDGRILVVGGKNSLDKGVGVPNPLTSAEIYDPVARTWARTGEMTEARFGHTATLLEGDACRQPNQPPASWCGKVLVVGGVSKELGREPIASAELYDPASGTWSSAGSLPQPRANHTASMMPDGRVLVAGGLTSGEGVGAQSNNSVLMYDAATNSWSPGPPMGTPRMIHTATTLQSGQVLVVGGFSGDYGQSVKSAELFDPLKNEWRVAGLAVEARAGHTATLLPSGFVVVAGGGPIYEDPRTRLDSLPSAEVYDPSANSWSAVRTLNTARGAAAAVALDGPACRSGSAPKYCGATLVMGGMTTSSDPNPKNSPVAVASAELYR